MSLGLVDEDEDISEITDRNYWEVQKATPKTMKIVDEPLELISEVIPGYQLKYNKFYIGLANNGRADNFVLFRAKRTFTRMEIRLDKSEDLENEIENLGLDLMDYDKRYGKYRIKISSNDLKKHRDFIKGLIRMSKGLPTEPKNDELNP